MKKILHVVNVPFVIPYFFGNQLNYFKENDFEVHVACSPSHKLKDYSEKYKFIPVPILISRKVNFIIDIISIYKLFIYIKKNQINIVVGHTPKGALIGIVASKLANVKVRIYFCHGLVFETANKLKKYILILIEKIISNLSTKILCVSDSVLKKYIALNIVKKNKLFLVKNGSCNGVDYTEKYNPDKIISSNLIFLKDKYKISNNTLVVGYVGRLANDKGINELVLAWQKVKSHKNNILLFLCGPLDERDSLNKITLDIIENDLTIKKLGEINETELFYSLFDLFILPSYREGFPTVVLEASSMRIPIITTKSTGCIDSIIENQTGLFTKIDNYDISQKILFYLNNKNLMKQHGENGRDFVIKNFNQEVIWQELIKIYTRS